MFKGWYELISTPFSRNKKEFVSVDARYDAKQDPRAYEMLSKETSTGVTPLEPVRVPDEGRRTPDYFGQTARYHAPQRSYSRPAPPKQMAWEPQQTYAAPMDDRNPLGMNNV